jgi:energy-coupling factor transport system ATP-binding protein
MALRGLNLSVNKGEFILLTGPSGCGKTTFCRCLNGLIPHFYSGDLKGEVKVAGFSTNDHHTTELARYVGLIFQNPDNQIFALTVEKDIAFGLENLGVNKEEMLKTVDWALEITGTSDLRERATHELSGGQKQRLAIASVLAMRPEIIVLDEPTSFLDPVGAEKIFEVLNFLNKEYRITIILIEHRVDLAARYADRVIVFSDGEIIQDNEPIDVFTDENTRLAGVSIPKVVEITKRLIRKGVILESFPITAEKFVEEIEKKLPEKKIKLQPRRPVTELRDLDKTLSSPLIEMIGVNYEYSNGVQALRNVSLTITKGEFVAIMGENGAGKTTLVKHFNGLLRPSRGKVFIDGVDISGMSVASLSRKVGLVFQNPDDQLFSENVDEEIRFALRNFGFENKTIDQRVNWAVNLLDIERYLKSSPFIDYAQKERLRHFLMQLRTQGKTTIIVTHDVEFVADCQPRIVLMAGGEIIADGTTVTIMNDTESLKQASISPPEITKIFSKLSRHDFPTDVMEVGEAAEILYTRLAEADQ